MPTLVKRPSSGSTTTAAHPRQKRRPLARWKVALALLLALLLHAALIVLLAWALPKWPRPPMKKGTPPAPIQLTLQSADPTPTPSLHKTEVIPPQPEYIRTPDANKSDTPPPDPKFISSENAQAQSEKPPEDLTKPLPSQDGKEMSSFEFETNPYIPGQEAHDTLAAAAPASEPAPTPPPVNPKAEPQESPTPPPTAKPTPPPNPDDFLTMNPEASLSNTPPPPSPTPRSTPKPTPNVQDALQRQLERVQRENRSFNSNSIRQPPGYQPQTTQTKMSGAVDSRTGKASVAALGTPLGRYEKAVGDAIGARWYFLVNDKMSTLVRTSEVKVHFVVTRSGRIIETRLSGPNTNTALADISLEAVTNAEVPPIPSDVAALLPAGQLEGDFVFSFFD